MKPVCLLVDHLDGEHGGFVGIAAPCLGLDTRLRRRPFSNLVPWYRRRALASIRQVIQPFLRFESDGFHDRRSMTESVPVSEGGVPRSKAGGVNVIAGGM